MKQKDIKLLWGRSGNRCAICKIQLSQGSTSPGSAFTLGEQAHIVGESEVFARGKSLLSADERECYHNRILLCPTHHTEIDKNEDRFPVERLHFLKSTHELWVTETLAASADARVTAHEVTLSSIIDIAVESCRLKDWKAWTSLALQPDPEWDFELPGSLFEFRQRAVGAIWPPAFSDLRRSTLTLSIILHEAAQTFLKHADCEGERYCANRFYRAGGHYNPTYDRDLQRYERWVQRCSGLIHQSTCAANWFADVVRRDINPMFFAATGKFGIIEGPFLPGGLYRSSFPEFSNSQKKTLPTSLRSKL